MLSANFAYFIQLACILGATGVRAEPIPKASDVGLPEGFTEIPLEWEVQSHPGGDFIHLTGTVEQVRATLLERNPNYDVDFGFDKQDESGLHFDDLEYDVEEGDDSGSAGLHRRGTCANDWRKIDCNIDGGRAQTRATREGIAYLRGVSGKPSLGAGPNACSRVSCSHKSAIWWCNHYDKPWSLGSFNSIANGAQCAYDKCQSDAKVKGWSYAKGSNWSVKVTGSSC